MSEFSVEDQLHAEVKRLQLINFQLEKRIISMKRKANIRKWEVSKLSKRLRERDEKLNYMNMPTSVRKGKGKKKKTKGVDCK